MRTTKLTTLSLAFIAFIAFAFTAPKASNFKVDTQKSIVTWTGKKVTGEHTGNIKISSGNLAWNGQTLTGGVFNIDMTTISNTDLTDKEYNDKLVGHLKSEDFFNVQKFPRATLKISKVEPKGGNNYDVSGNLTIKGITNPITFPATITSASNTITAKAKVIVDRSKYDVRYGSKSFFEGLGDKVIYDDFDIDVNIVASK